MKQIIFIACALLPIIGLAQGGTCIINLNVGKVEARTAYLSYQQGETRLVDSAHFMNGKCTFHREIPYPLATMLWLDNRGFGYANGHRPDMLIVYLEKGVVNITTSDSVKNAVIKGGRINTDYNVYKKWVAGPMKTLEDCNADLMLATKEQRADTAFANERYRGMRVAGANLKERDLQYVKQHPDSYCSLAALTEAAGAYMKVGDIEPLYQSLSAKVRNTEPGKDLGRSIEAAKMTAVGSMAPDFTQNDVNDRPVKLSEFHGKYVLLDFWASWCGPCRAENPNYVKAYQTYKDRNFTLLGVSLDRAGEKKAWLDAIQKDGLEWTQVSDLKYWFNEVAKLYNIRAVPQNFLIDPNGKIIAKDLRGEELLKKLAELLPGN